MSGYADLANDSNITSNITSNLKSINELYAKANLLRKDMDFTAKQYTDFFNTYASSLTDDDLSNLQETVLYNKIKNIDVEKMLNQSNIEDAVAAIGDARSKVEQYVNEVSSYSDDVLIPMNAIFEVKTDQSYADYRSQVDALLNKIMATDDWRNGNIASNEDELKVLLGLSVETDDGEIEDEIQKHIENVVHKTFMLQGATMTELQKLTVDQLERLYSVDYDTAGIKDFADVLKYLNTSGDAFNLEDYSDKLSEVTSNLSTLGEAYKKYLTGELNTSNEDAVSEVLDLITKFEDLNEYVDVTDYNFGNLGEGLKQLIIQQPDELITKFKQLKNLSADDQKEVNNLVASLERMRNSLFDVDMMEALGLTESDYLDYQIKQYDKIIDKLNDKKDAIQETNDRLEKEKELVDELAEKYSTVGDNAQLLMIR